MSRPTVFDVVRSGVEVKEITCVKQVIMLKGFRDDGKTTVLKEVIKRLHQLFPNAWKSHNRYDPKQFDLSKVSTVVKNRDWLAVLEINGITVLIYTGGDNPSVIARTFAIAVKVEAQIVVTALKVKKEGNGTTRAQQAYDLIANGKSFETTCVDICGRRLRSVQASQSVAKEIVEIVLQQIGVGDQVK